MTTLFGSAWIKHRHSSPACFDGPAPQPSSSACFDGSASPYSVALLHMQDTPAADFTVVGTRSKSGTTKKADAREETFKEQLRERHP
ncbi:hypothetical protein OROHE_002745 [Orobanche hederae]